VVIPHHLEFQTVRELRAAWVALPVETPGRDTVLFLSEKLLAWDEVYRRETGIPLRAPSEAPE
jgi:hypothetical protein